MGVGDASGVAIHCEEFLAAGESLEIGRLRDEDQKRILEALLEIMGGRFASLSEFLVVDKDYAAAKGFGNISYLLLIPADEW